MHVREEGREVDASIFWQCWAGNILQLLRQQARDYDAKECTVSHCCVQLWEGGRRSQDPWQYDRKQPGDTWGRGENQVNALKWLNWPLGSSQEGDRYRARCIG